MLSLLSISSTRGSAEEPEGVGGEVDPLSDDWSSVGEQRDSQTDGLVLR